MGSNAAGSTRPTPDVSSGDAVRAAWEANADFWDAGMGEGNLFHRELVGPAAERLLSLRPGERVVEFACGNGQFSRRMAELGAFVFATDLSARLVELVRRRTAARPELAGRATFERLDAADPAALAGIPSAPYDAAVCNMAIMDMIAVEPLFRAMPALLRSEGRFVFTIMHPAFNAPGGSTLCAEEADNDGDLVTTHSVRVVRYRTLGAVRGLAMVGQPQPQWYMHRTLTTLLGAAFAAGLVMDGIEEPCFPASVAETAPPLSWRRFTDVPPVLAVRLRPA